MEKENRNNFIEANKSAKNDNKEDGLINPISFIDKSETKDNNGLIIPFQRITDEAKKSEQSDSKNVSEKKLQQVFSKIPMEGYDDVAHDKEKFITRLYEDDFLHKECLCTHELGEDVWQTYNKQITTAKEASITNEMNTAELTKDESEVQFKETTAAPVQAQSETKDLNSDFKLQSSAPQVHAASVPTQPETNYKNPDFTSQNPASQMMKTVNCGFYPNMQQQQQPPQYVNGGNAMPPFTPGLAETNSMTSMPSNTKNDSPSVKPYKIARMLLKSLPVRNNLKELFYYSDHYYKKLTDNQALSLILENIREEVCNISSSGFLNSVLKFMILDREYTIPENYDESRYLTFENAIIDLSTNQVLPNDGRVFVTSKINTDFVGFNYAPDTPVWEIFINTITNGDEDLKARIMQVIGYYITLDTDASVFTVLYGRAASGKSVLGNFLNNLFNDGATSGIDISNIADRFAASGLVGKRLNLAMDIPEGRITAKTASMLKRLTGKDLAQVESKFKDSVPFRCQTKFIFGSNFPLNVDHADEGIERRLLVIPFINQVPKEARDPNLLYKLLAEKQGIIHKALSYYYELRANNYVFRSINNDFYNSCLFGSDSSTIKSTENIVKEFVEDCCVFGADYIEHNSVIYNQCLAYCNNKGYPAPQNQGAFTSILYSILSGKVKSNKFRKNGANLNGTIGIALKNNTNV